MNHNGVKWTSTHFSAFRKNKINTNIVNYISHWNQAFDCSQTSHRIEGPFFFTLGRLNVAFSSFIVSRLLEKCAITIFSYHSILRIFTGIYSFVHLWTRLWSVGFGQKEPFLQWEKDYVNFNLEHQFSLLAYFVSVQAISNDGCMQSVCSSMIIWFCNFTVKSSTTKHEWNMKFVLATFR